MNDNKLLEIKEMLNSLDNYAKASEINKINNEFNELKSTLNNNNIFIEDFKSFKASLTNTVNETSKDIILLQTKINTINNSELKDEYNSIKEELNNKNSEFKKEYINLKEDLNNISLYNKEAIKNNEELKTKYEKLKEDNTLLNKDLYETKNSIFKYREEFISELQKAKQEITTEVVNSIKEFIKQNLK